MAIKSVIEVDIDKNGNFARFKALYDQYEKKLAGAPKAWQQVQNSIGGSAKSFRELLEMEVAAIGKAQMLAEVNKAAARAARTNADAWRDAARHTKDSAVSIASMTGQLLKWSTVLGVFSGVLGAGGLFGITRFAESAAAGRRSSSGIGSSYGEQKSFETNFSRVVDPGSVLGGVNSALTDISKRSNLYNAGLGEGDLQGGAAAVSARLVSKLKDLADQTPNELLGQIIEHRGFGALGFSIEDAQRIKRTSRGELAGVQSGYASGTSNFGAADADTRAFQELVTKIGAAGNTIESVFIRLAPLAPGLTKLSESVTETVKSFVDNGGFKDLVEQVGEGVKTLATYLGSKDFQDDVKVFAGGIASIARGIKWLGGGSSGAPALGEHEGHDTWNTSWRRSREIRANVGSLLPGGNIAGLVNSPAMKPGSGIIDPGLGAFAGYLQKNVAGAGIVTAANDRYHIGHKSAHNDGRAFDLRVNDPAQSEAVAQKIRDEMQRLGIAGKVINEYTNPSSRSTAPHLHVQADKRVDIRVFNDTGGSAVITANQVAQ